MLASRSDVRLDGVCRLGAAEIGWRVPDELAIAGFATSIGTGRPGSPPCAYRNTASGARPMR